MNKNIIVDMPTRSVFIISRLKVINIYRYIQSKRRLAYRVPALPVDSPLTKNS